MTQELKVPFTLKDSGESDKQIEGCLIITSRGIEITLEGYSTAVEADEGGHPYLYRLLRRSAQDLRMAGYQ